jgi:hypothetical protein
MNGGLIDAKKTEGPKSRDTVPLVFETMHLMYAEGRNESSHHTFTVSHLHEVKGLT